MKSLRQLLAMAAIAQIWTGIAAAAPTDYLIDGPDGATGTFRVDPALANPIGEDFIPLIDWSITLNTAFEPAPFVFVLGPGDLTADLLRARFLDGQLAGIDSGFATAEKMVGSETYGFALFIDARGAISAATIDRDFAGEFNVGTFLGSGPGLEFEDNCCSYGFSQADGGGGSVVPEPTAALLFGVGTFVVAAVVRRRDAVVGPF